MEGTSLPHAVLCQPGQPEWAQIHFQDGSHCWQVHADYEFLSKWASPWGSFAFLSTWWLDSMGDYSS